MRRVGTARSLVVLGGAAMIACSDVFGPGHPRDSVTIDVSAVVTNYQIVTGPSGWPYAQCDVELIAKASGKGSATWVAGRDRWFWGLQRDTARDSLAVPSAELVAGWSFDSIAAGQVQSSRWWMNAPYPFELELSFFVRSKGASDSTSGTTRLACGPTPPAVAPRLPTFTGAELLPPTRPREPGDSVQLAFTMGNPGGLWVSQVLVTGAFEWDTTFAESMQASSSRTVTKRIPVGTDLGVLSDVWFFVLDQFGQYARVVKPIEGLVDRTPPKLSMYFNYALPTPGGVFFVGESAISRVFASDNHLATAIVWYAIPSGPRDSVLGLEPLFGSEAFATEFGPEWLGVDGMGFFARDASGNESARIVSTPGALRIAPTIQRSWRNISVQGSITDFVIDTLRDVIYLSQGNQKRIAVLSMATGRVTGTIGVPAFGGMDLSLDGNTLLAAVADSLAMIDVRSATNPTVSMLPLTALDATLHQTASGASVRAVGNGKLFLTVSGTWPNGLRLYEIDPATGQQRVRSDGAEGGFAAGAIERSVDRSTLVVNRANCEQRYDSGTDTFGACSTIIPKNLSPLPDRTGQLFLLGLNVYDASLSLLRTVESAYDLLGGTPMSVFDGSGEYVYHYLGPRGILRSRVSDGYLLDRIAFNDFMPTAMKLSPDGKKLVLIENHYSLTSKVSIIDLTSPP